MSDVKKEFPVGLFVSPPRPQAPAFVKARISIRCAEFSAFLKDTTDEWMRIDVLESRSKVDDNGLPKWYATIDTWRPTTTVSHHDEEEDVF